MKRIDCDSIERTLNSMRESVRRLRCDYGMPEMRMMNGEFPKETVKRGELIFERIVEYIRNLNDVMTKEEEIVEIFRKWREMKEEMNTRCNQTITMIVRAQKMMMPREEYLKNKTEWDNKRKEYESIEERKHRECEEILNEVREERDSEF